MITKQKTFYFEDLDVYQKALNFVCKVYDLYDEMAYKLQKTIGDNLLRAAISVINNIAEGSGRRSNKEKRHYFEISQGSVFECVPILTILNKKNAIKETIFQDLYEDCHTISKMIGGLIKRFA